MKRKFFSLVVAACAALFTFSGLTGCAGGGGDDLHGVVTLEDFENGRKGFVLMFGSSSIEIQPIAGSGSQYEVLGYDPLGNAVEEDVKATGLRCVDCTFAGYEAIAIYTIASWSQTSEKPDGEVTLYVTFKGEDASKALNDPVLIGALGGDSGDYELKSNIKITLDYNTNTGGSTTVFSFHKGDGTPDEADVDAEGTFVVKKY